MHAVKRRGFLGRLAAILGLGSALAASAEASDPRDIAEFMGFCGDHPEGKIGIGIRYRGEDMMTWIDAREFLRSGRLDVANRPTQFKTWWDGPTYTPPKVTV